MMHDKCSLIPTSQWHEESFTSKEVTSSDTYQLHLSKTNKTLTIDSSMSMIDALKASSIPVETVCEQGICGSCIVEWSEGDPIHNDQCLDESERENYVAVCSAGCKSSSLTLEL